MRRQLDPCTRMLVRHQWVRHLGTPRVSTLIGDVARARELWDAWVSAAAPRSRAVFLSPADSIEITGIDRVARDAVRRAETSPGTPIALALPANELAGWLERRDDRVASLIREGAIAIPPRRAPTATRPPSKRAIDRRARSLAELALFEALEGTASTAGRFELNASASFVFGSRAAEVDLLSRRDALAIEVDGYHHFEDAARYRTDRSKDRLLQSHGFDVLRFLADDVLADPRRVVRDVVEFLGHRRRTPPKGDPG